MKSVFIPNHQIVLSSTPGKLVSLFIQTFRPISLTSFLLKALEWLVDRYLKEGSHRYAYQSGKSTETALHQLTRRIQGALLVLF